MSDGLDPEIAALLANSGGGDSAGDAAVDTSDITTLDSPSAADFSASSSGSNKSIHEVDLSRKEFAPIEKFVNDTPSDVFNDTKYYKTALTGENQSAQRVHQVLSKYLTCQDPKDRAVYRQQIVTAYWELLRGMVGKMGYPDTPMPKKMLVRFGVLLPSLFKQETKEFFSKIFFENREAEPIMYVDEWFKEIASGRMNNSATDEKKQVSTKNMTPDQAASAEQSRLMQLQSKNSGKLQSAENVLGIKENERRMLEGELQRNIEDLCIHNPILGLDNHTAGYTENVSELWGHTGDQDGFIESMAAAAQAVHNFFDNGNKILYISVMNKMSIDCDCNGNPQAPLIANYGIIASLDPVALDQAAFDIVSQIHNDEHNNTKPLLDRIASKHGTHIMEWGEKIGLGSRKYTIVSIDKQ